MARRLSLLSLCSLVSPFALGPGRAIGVARRTPSPLAQGPAVEKAGSLLAKLLMRPFQTFALRALHPARAFVAPAPRSWHTSTRTRTPTHLLAQPFTNIPASQACGYRKWYQSRPFQTIGVQGICLLRSYLTEAQGHGRAF